MKDLSTYKKDDRIKVQLAAGAIGFATILDHGPNFYEYRVRFDANEFNSTDLICVIQSYDIIGFAS